MADYEFTELNLGIRRMITISQWQEDLDTFGGSWTTTLEDTDDGTGDVILTFPDELVMLKGWTEGTILNLGVEESPRGNVLIITEVKNESI